MRYFTQCRNLIFWLIVGSLILGGCSLLMPQSTPTIDIAPTPTFPAEKLGIDELDIPYCQIDPQADPEAVVQKMDIYYPRSEGPWPVLIYIHGGSWRELDKAEGGAWAFFRDAGILVISINYRLATDKIKFPAMIEDVKCAVRHLRANAANYNLDPAHIAAMGWSAGGHLAALVGTSGDSTKWDVGPYLEQSSRVQAVISLAGLSDLSYPMNNDIAASIYYAFGKQGGLASPELEAASPITYISADDPPFFIVHGTLDTVVDHSQSEILHSRLIEVGVPSTFISMQNGDHGLHGQETSPSMGEIVEMMKAFLLAELK